MSAIRSALPALGLLSTLLLLMPATAQSAQEREIEAARQRVRALRQEAEQLQERIAAAERRREQEGRGRANEEILQGLRQGMAALRALGAMDALEHLERIAAELEQRGGRREPLASDNRVTLRDEEIEVMRLAIRGLVEAEHIDAAEILERAIEVSQAARRARTDRAIAELRQEAPSLGNRIEALLLAERVYREFDAPDRADMVGRYARSLMEQPDRPRETDRPRGEPTERQAARRQLDIMRMALQALADADREDAADLLEREMHIRELALEGRGFEGERPSRGAQAEVMMLAAEILADRGRGERAQAVGEYARQLASQARELRDAPRREGEPRVNGRTDQIRQLETRLDRLAEAMQELRAAVQQLRRDRDRD